ncbi:PilN domain-containing protein [Patescibacteria group bacterium]|nr:PilN domain-containing protein [Patescibacteria group bacterium]MBU1868668.1 PilN domain-containing protein [Patescibacteria group bacterium]
MPEERKELPNEIQLLPPEEIERRKTVAERYLRVVSGVSIFLVVVQIIALTTIIIKANAERDLHRKAQALELVIGELESYSETERQLRLLGENVKLIEELRKANNVTPELLSAIEQSLPVDIYLDSIQLGDVLNIRGQTYNYLSVFRFLNRLQEQEQVDEALLAGLTRKSAGGAVEFAITFKLVKD